jgi:hypothetical protein
LAFSANVLQILVASPGDVGDERDVIPEVINEWNAVSARQTNSILMPVKWETHSAPLLGNRPQAVINQQLVTECDLLVGVFWTRIGTHTGVSVSGTAEEIEQFVDKNKPVMLYFSQMPVDPDKIEVDQFSTLRLFKEKMRLKGLTESYSGIPDFRQKFSRQLGINLNTILQKSAVKSTPTTRSNRHKDPTLESPPGIAPPANSEALSQVQIDGYLIKAITTTARRDGWANMASVGLYLRTYTPVDYKRLGFQTLKKFLASTKLVEIKSEQKSNKASGLDSADVRLVKKAP